MSRASHWSCRSVHLAAAREPGSGASPCPPPDHSLQTIFASPCNGQLGRDREGWAVDNFERHFKQQLKLCITGLGRKRPPRFGKRLASATQLASFWRPSNGTLAPMARRRAIGTGVHVRGSSHNQTGRRPAAEDAGHAPVEPGLKSLRPHLSLPATRGPLTPTEARKLFWRKTNHAQDGLPGTGLLWREDRASAQATPTRRRLGSHPPMACGTHMTTCLSE